MLERIPETNFFIDIVGQTDYYLSFKIHQNIGSDETSPLFHANGECSADGLSETPNADKPFIEGSIKWDGCCDWGSSADAFQFHFCGQGDAMEFGKSLAWIYEVLGPRLVKWDG